MSTGASNDIDKATNIARSMVTTYGMSESLGPLALGHTLYNASLRRVHATYVNIISAQEVTGGIFLSWLLLAQTPSPNSLIGALVTLVGTGLVLR